MHEVRSLKLGAQTLAARGVTSIIDSVFRNTRWRLYLVSPTAVWSKVKVKVTANFASVANTTVFLGGAHRDTTAPRELLQNSLGRLGSAHFGSESSNTIERFLNRLLGCIRGYLLESRICVLMSHGILHIHES